MPFRRDAVNSFRGKRHGPTIEAGWAGRDRHGSRVERARVRHRQGHLGAARCEGAKLVLVDKDEERASDTLKVIEGEGGTATIVVADLADPYVCQGVVDQAVAAFGKADILVNNAAVTGWGDIIETTLEWYQLTIAVNLTAPFMLSKAAIPIMLENGGGSIVNITSIVGMRGAGARQPAYAAAKAGLAGLMRELADTFGTPRHPRQLHRTGDDQHPRPRCGPG